MIKHQKKSGNFYEMSLNPFSDKKFYFLYIHVKKLFPDTAYPDLIYIYDHFEDSLTISLTELAKKPLLVNPQFISGSNGLGKVATWLGFEEIFIPNITLPYVRKKNQPFYLPHNGNWDILNYREEQVFENLPIEKCAQLDEIGGIYIDYLPFKVMIELSKLGHLKLQNMLNLLTVDFIHKDLIEKNIEMPLYAKVQVLYEMNPYKSPLLIHKHSY